MTYEEKTYKETRMVAICIIISLVLVVAAVFIGAGVVPPWATSRNAVACKEACVTGCKTARSDGFECQSKLEGKADVNLNLKGLVR